MTIVHLLIKHAEIANDLTFLSAKAEFNLKFDIPNYEAEKKKQFCLTTILTTFQ